MVLARLFSGVGRWSCRRGADCRRIAGRKTLVGHLVHLRLVQPVSERPDQPLDELGATLRLRQHRIAGDRAGLFERPKALPENGDQLVRHEKFLEELECLRMHDAGVFTGTDHQRRILPRVPVILCHVGKREINDLRASSFQGATDLTVGTGQEAVLGRSVTVQYTGWLYHPNAAQNRGPQFDSGTFGPFALGTTVIQGWTQGLQGMRVGGSRRLVIPPSLGYGPTGNGPIPGNATLLFEVTLLNVQ